MTLQQLEYIVALNKYRHFVEAAEACGVTQPTLSHMVQKLETELGVKIFDRKKHPIVPTIMGERLISQAVQTLKEMRKMEEIVTEETQTLSGKLRIGIIPTLAPYLVPGFLKYFLADYPSVELSLSELPTASCIKALNEDRIDMFIAATPLEVEAFYEIPLYYERFVAYFSTDHALRDVELTAQSMPEESIWVLHEGHCLRDQVFNFCTAKLSFKQAFEAGSIDTLIRIVDTNGGYSVIPEMHLPFLTESQKQNVREIKNPPAVREISAVIHQGFVKERMINAVADTVKKLIPVEMLDERLKKFSIRL